MVDKKVAEMLNKQINLELFSGYLYLEISNYYADQGLNGFAHWFVLQADEEYSHAMRIRTFLIDNDLEINLDAIKNPTTELKNIKQGLDLTLSHEKEITQSINNIYSVALEKGDYRSKALLDWFVAEQAEEEATAKGLIDNFNLYGGDGGGLFRIDEQMGARVAGAPLEPVV